MPLDEALKWYRSGLFTECDLKPVASGPIETTSPDTYLGPARDRAIIAAVRQDARLVGFREGPDHA